MKTERLEEFNNWWFSSEVPSDLLEGYKRKIFTEVREDIKRRQIVSVTGLRRVGKTTLMYQLIDHLLKKKTDPANILFFSFDESVKDLDDVLNTYREIKNKEFRGQRVFVFLDEIQKLEGWQDQIKKYYDLYPKLKFVISGSESLFIARKSRETLAGRIFEHRLSSLSFREFLELNGVQADKVPQIKLRSFFRDFILKGGLPEMVEEPDLDSVRRYAREGIIGKVIYKDILKLSGIKDTDLLTNILEIIAENPGMYLEYQSLARQLDRDRRTIKKYIMLLKDSFLIKLMKNYRGSKAASLRKAKRAYLCDNSLITAFKPKVDEAFFGKMVENAAARSIKTDFFWRNSNEVDFIVEKKPVEVKYKEKTIKKDYKGVLEFMRTFDVENGRVITKNEEKKIKVKEGTLKLIPAHKFLLEKDNR